VAKKRNLKILDEVISEYEENEYQALMANLNEVLFKYKPPYTPALKSGLMELHQLMERMFDEILLAYFGNKSVNEELYTQRLSEVLGKHYIGIESCVLFYVSFLNKKKIIEKIVGLSEFTIEVIEEFNELRNILVHTRYELKQRKFFYKECDVFKNSRALRDFLEDIIMVLRELRRIKNKIEQTIAEVRTKEMRTLKK
jgi:hypothetical protein